MAFRRFLKALVRAVLVSAVILFLAFCWQRWWFFVVDDSLVTVVNATDKPLQASLRASKTYSLDGLQPGRRRRIAHHPVVELSYVIEWAQASGKVITAESPYHADLLELVEDGPDHESIALFQGSKLRILNVDELSSQPDGSVLGRLAGYEPDKRIPNPSGSLEAVVRVGPSLTSNRAWRVMVVAHGLRGTQGVSVFEAKEVEDFSVRWASDRALIISARRARPVRIDPWALMPFEGPGFISTRFEVERKPAR